MEGTFVLSATLTDELAVRRVRWDARVTWQAVLAGLATSRNVCYFRDRA